MAYKTCCKAPALCLVLLLCAPALAACAAQPVPPLAAAITQPPAQSTLDVIFFNCGDGDSILLRQGEHALLIDAATDKDSAKVLAGLERLGVTALDALLITHGDKDHVGGADHVLQSLDVARAYVGEIGKNSKQVRQFEEALEARGMAAQRLAAGDAFDLGLARVTVLGPLGSGYEQENDASLVVRVDFGETRFLFTGDAENESLGELLGAPDPAALRAQVLKVPHHGKAEKLSAAFFETVAPAWAVISCQRGTNENLPHAATLAALQAAGARTLVTGDGEVSISSNGKTLAVHQAGIP
jgi:beta-lactamase superfamily II metal-dependent hydrolase